MTPSNRRAIIAAFGMHRTGAPVLTREYIAIIVVFEHVTYSVDRTEWAMPPLNEYAAVFGLNRVLDRHWLTPAEVRKSSRRVAYGFQQNH